MAISKVLPGKKTHILVALALVAGAASYGIEVLNNGFDFQTLLAFVKSEAMTGAISMVRLGLGKK
jgi:hypothetical protein